MRTVPFPFCVLMSGPLAAGVCQLAGRSTGLVQPLVVGGVACLQVAPRYGKFGEDALVYVLVSV